jgi:hypothetical protein
MNTNKKIGIVMLIALLLRFVPFFNFLDQLGTVALFIIAIWMIVK